VQPVLRLIEDQRLLRVGLVAGRTDLLAQRGAERRLSTKVGHQRREFTEQRSRTGGSLSELKRPPMLILHRTTAVRAVRLRPIPFTLRTATCRPLTPKSCKVADLESRRLKLTCSS